MMQSKYDQYLLSCFYMVDCKPTITPFLSSVKLMAAYSSPLVDSTKYK